MPTLQTLVELLGHSPRTCFYREQAETIERWKACEQVQEVLTGEQNRLQNWLQNKLHELVREPLN